MINNIILWFILCALCVYCVHSCLKRIESSYVSDLKWNFNQLYRNWMHCCINCAAIALYHSNLREKILFSSLLWSFAFLKKPQIVANSLNGIKQNLIYIQMSYAFYVFCFWKRSKSLSVSIFGLHFRSTIEIYCTTSIPAFFCYSH